MGRLPEVKRKIIEMSVNASGIRDTARVLGTSTTTVINEIKKKDSELQAVNQAFLEASQTAQENIEVQIIRADKLQNDQDA